MIANAHSQHKKEPCRKDASGGWLRTWEEYGPPPAPRPLHMLTRREVLRVIQTRQPRRFTPSQERLLRRLADLAQDKGWCIFSTAAWQKHGKDEQKEDTGLVRTQLLRTRRELVEQQVIFYEPFPEEEAPYVTQPGNGWIGLRPLAEWVIPEKKWGGIRDNAGRKKAGCNNLISTQTSCNNLIPPHRTCNNLISQDARHLSPHSQASCNNLKTAPGPSSAEHTEPTHLLEADEEIKLIHPPEIKLIQHTSAGAAPDKAPEAALSGEERGNRERGTSSLELSDDSSREAQPQAASPQQVKQVHSQETNAWLEEMTVVLANMDQQDARLFVAKQDAQKLLKEPYRWEPGMTSWRMRENAQQATDEHIRFAGLYARVRKWIKLVQDEGLSIEHAQRIVEGKELYVPLAEKLGAKQEYEDEKAVGEELAEEEGEREWWPLLTTNEWRAALFSTLSECFYPVHKPSKPEHDALVDPVNKLLAARIRPEQVAQLKHFFERQPTNKNLRGKWYPARYLLQVIAPFKDWMDDCSLWGEALPYLKTYRHKPYGQALEEVAQSKENRAAKKKTTKTKAASVELRGQGQKGKKA